MFGKKKEEEKNEKACPFAFSFSRMPTDKGINQLGKCIKDICQMWDSERNDCGLKEK